MQIIPRPYQRTAIDKAIWSLQLQGNDLISMPTGSGKSIVVAGIGHQADQDVLILQPSREILAQNRAKLEQYVPLHEIGTYSASFNSKQIRRFTFATIQTVYKLPELFAHFGLILIDEVHTMNPKNEKSMFTSFISTVNKFRAAKSLPVVKLIGLTATPWRNVLGYHKDHNGNLYSGVTLKLMNRMKPLVWDRMLYHINIEELIVDGYLSPMVYDDCSRINHSDIPLNISRSDFNLNVFVDKLDAHLPTVLARIKEAEQDHKSVLIFCATVEQARQLSQMVSGSAWVSGDTPVSERDMTVHMLKTHQIKTVFNCAVFGIGFDHPTLDCIIMLRPTKSLGLYYQFAGRGSRIAPGKRHCEFIDFSGTVKLMGAIETIKLVKEQQPEFKNPVWELYCGGQKFHNKLLYKYEIKSNRSPSLSFRNWR